MLGFSEKLEDFIEKTVEYFNWYFYGSNSHLLPLVRQFYFDCSKVGPLLFKTQSFQANIFPEIYNLFYVFSVDPNVLTYITDPNLALLILCPILIVGSGVGSSATLPAVSLLSFDVYSKAL